MLLSDNLQHKDVDSVVHTEIVEPRGDVPVMTALDKQFTL